MPVPPDVRDRIARVLDAARRSSPPGAARWVGPDAFHLTIRFLGATPADRVAGAAEAVVEAARGSREFEIALHGSGAFPRPAEPRTLWLGVSAGGADLAALAVRLDGALATRGWVSEGRPFRAHLTLARCEDPRGGLAAAAALAAAASRFAASWRAGSLVLYESHLGRGPARYVVVAEAPFGR